MILVGNQRGGGMNLAAHLLKAENDHVTVHELRGFAGETLREALNEAYAISRGTRCTQYLFSLSLNPPPESRVSIETFEAAIDRVEEKLGLTGQPRAIVFHEKDGRRHAHAVWSRIDPETMTAIPLPYTRQKMQEIARDLFIEQGWQMPKGLAVSGEADPRNFTLAEWQQAKRQGKDPRVIKAAFQDAWAISDSPLAFAQALKARGYWLARGERRSFVAVDIQGEVYAVAKWVGVKTKDVRARLGPEDALPSLDQAKAEIARTMTETLSRLKTEADAKQKAAQDIRDRQRDALVAKQKAERAALDQTQEVRRTQELKARQARFRTGLRGIWDRVTGAHARIKAQNENEAYAAFVRDRTEREALIVRHLETRQALKGAHAAQLSSRDYVRAELDSDLAAFSKDPSSSSSSRRSSPSLSRSSSGSSSTLGERLDRLRARPKTGAAKVRRPAKDQEPEID